MVKCPEIVVSEKMGAIHGARAASPNDVSSDGDDFDADGLTGTAILLETLRTLGADPKPFIPHRENEGHGISEKGLNTLVDIGCELIITVDTGTNSDQIIEVPVNINLSSDLERGSELVFSFELLNNEYSVLFNKSFFVPAPNFQLEIEGINDNNDNIPEPGESFWITINVSNVGNYPSDSLFVNCSAIDENSEFVFIDNPNI